MERAFQGRETIGVHPAKGDGGAVKGPGESNGCLDPQRLLARMRSCREDRRDEPQRCSLISGGHRVRE